MCASAATLESPPIRWLIRAYVEIFRNVPIPLWTYFAFYGIGRLGFGVLDNVWSFVLALSLYGGAYLTEVFRAGLGAIPGDTGRRQWPGLGGSSGSGWSPCR